MGSPRRSSVMKSRRESSQPDSETPNLDNESGEGIVVAIRMRPLNQKEGDKNRIWKVLPKYSSVTQTTRDGKPLPEKITGRTFFTYDKVFGEDVSTSRVYDAVAKNVVSSVVGGMNGTVFAYGQTSSGKTYTMQGSGTIEQGNSGAGGIVHMAATDIFDQITNAPDRIFLVRASFLEIYNEEVRDLLSNSSKVLPIREDPRRGVFVQSVEEIVTDFESLLRILYRGEKSRAFAATAMNERSSRSHTIFRITIESRQKVDDTDGEDTDGSSDDEHSGTNHGGAVRVSTLNLVDLAGSESVRHTGATGDRQKEGGMINQSLLTLSQVILKLGQSHSMHINFRDSKLTRILQPSLSGNARMAVICCATPSELYLEETRSTLQFAARAKLVKTNAKVNEVLDDRSMIRKLQRELAEAKRLGTEAGNIDEMRKLEDKAATADNAATEARAELNRLKASILNVGSLFVQSHPSTSSPSRRGRRLSDSGVAHRSRGTPTKVHEALFVPSTIPRPMKKRKIQDVENLAPTVEVDFYKKALSTKVDQIGTLEGVVSNYSTEVEARKEDLNRAQKEAMGLRESKDDALAKIGDLENQISLLRSQIEDQQKTHLAEMSNKEATEAEARRLIESQATQLRDLESANLSLSEKNSAFQAQVAEFRGILDGRASEVQRLQETVTACEAANAEIVQEKHSLENAKEQLMKRVESLELRCSELDAHLGESKKYGNLAAVHSEMKSKQLQSVEENSERQVKALADAKKSLESDFASLAAKLEAAEATVQQRDREALSLNKKVLEACQEKTQLAADMKELRKENDDLRALVDEGSKARERLECENQARTKNVESLQARQNELEQENHRVRQTMKEDAETIVVLGNEKKGLEEHVTSLESQLREKTTMLTQQAENAQKDLIDAQDAAAKVASEKSALLERFEKTKLDLKEHKTAWHQTKVKLDETEKLVAALRSAKAIASTKGAQYDAENTQLLIQLESARSETEAFQIRNEELTTQLQALSKQKAKAEKDLEDLTAEVKCIQCSLNSSSTLVVRLKDERMSLQRKVSESAVKAATLEATLATSRAHAESENNLLAERLKLFESKLRETEEELSLAFSQNHRLYDIALSLSNERDYAIMEQHELDKEIEVLSNKEQSLLRAVEDYENQVAIAREHARKAEAALVEMQEKSKGLETREAGLLARNESLLTDLETNKQRVDELVQSLEKASASVVCLEDANAALKEEIAEATDQSLRLSEIAIAFQTDHDILAEEKHDLVERNYVLDQQLRAKIEELDSKREQCDSLEQNICALKHTAESYERSNSEIQREMAQLQGAHGDAKSRISDLLSKVEEYNRSRDALEGQHEQLKERLRQTLASKEALQQRYDNIETERNSVTDQLREECLRGNELASKAGKLEKLFNDLQQEMSRSKEEHDTLKEEAKELQLRLASSNESLAQSQLSIDAFKKDLLSTSRKLEDVSFRNAQLEEELRLAETSLVDIDSVNADSKSLLEEVHNIAEENKSLKAMLESERKEWSTTEAALIKRMGDEQRALVAEGESVMSKLREDQDKLKTSNKKLESEAYRSRQLLEELRELIDNKTKDLETNIAENRQLSARLSSKEKAVNELRNEIQTIASERERLFSEMSVQTRKLARIESLEESNEALSKEVARLRRDQAQIAELKNEIKRLRRLPDLSAKSCNDESYYMKQIDDLKAELVAKNARVQKLEKVKMSKEKLQHFQAVQKKNDDLEEEVRRLRKGDGRRDDENKSKVAELTFDNEALKKKLRKREAQCQSLLEEKASLVSVVGGRMTGMASDDLHSMIVKLCDRVDGPGATNKSPKGTNKNLLCQAEREIESLKEQVKTLNDEMALYKVDYGSTADHRNHEDRMKLEDQCRALQRELQDLYDEKRQDRKKIKSLQEQLRLSQLGISEEKTLEFSSSGMIISREKLTQTGGERRILRDRDQASLVMNEGGSGSPQAKKTDKQNRRGLTGSVTDKENSRTVENESPLEVHRKRYNAEADGFEKRQVRQRKAPGLGESGPLDSDDAVECKQS